MSSCYTFNKEAIFNKLQHDKFDIKFRCYKFENWLGKIPKNHWTTCGQLLELMQLIDNYSFTEALKS